MIMVVSRPDCQGTSKADLSLIVYFVKHNFVSFSVSRAHSQWGGSYIRHMPTYIRFAKSQ